MLRRFKCVVCGNIVKGEPPNLIVCKKCKAYYIFKYSKDYKNKIRKGHYIFAGFLDDRF